MYLLVHLHSGAEIQRWMHKRLWPEGKGKQDLQNAVDQDGAFSLILTLLHYKILWLVANKEKKQETAISLNLTLSER